MGWFVQVGCREEGEGLQGSAVVPCYICISIHMVCPWHLQVRAQLVWGLVYRCPLPSGLWVYQQSRPWQIRRELISIVYLHAYTYDVVLCFNIFSLSVLSSPSSPFPCLPPLPSFFFPLLLPLSQQYACPDYFPVVYPELPQQPTHRQAIINAFVYVHQTLHQANTRLAKRGSSTMAVTPRHYLDFINHYVSGITVNNTCALYRHSHTHVQVQHNCNVNG